MYDTIKEFKIVIESKHFKWTFAVFFTWCSLVFVCSINVLYEIALQILADLDQVAFDPLA